MATVAAEELGGLAPFARQLTHCELALQALEEAKHLLRARLMRLLIDECIDERLRRLFTGHECQTARRA